MLVEKLANNQYVVRINRYKIFQSYETIIAIKKDENVWLSKNWNYSRTTTKYLKRFLGDSCLDVVHKRIKSKFYKVVDLKDILCEIV